MEEHWAEQSVDSLDREQPSPPTASLHAWPFKTVMLSHVIRRPAGNHLLKAGSPTGQKEKGKRKTRCWLEWQSTGCDWFVPSMHHLHTSRQKATCPSETAAAALHKPWVGSSISGKGLSLRHEVLGLRITWAGLQAQWRHRSGVLPVCVLTRATLLIRSPAMFSPTSGYYVMFVSVTPWLIRLF